MTSPGEEIRAGIYTRMSLALMNDKAKVSDQESISRDLAGRLGWNIAEGVGYKRTDGVYCDNSSSAWNLKHKRPAWEEMLRDVEAGKINAIVVYHGDRLLRTHDDLLKLIHLARTRAIRLASPTGVRDIGNYDDQFILEIEASMAKRESANTSRRRKQQYERWRRQGRELATGTGGRRFGFDTNGVDLYPPCRADVATHEEHTEAEIIREMAARVLAGETCGAVARDLNARDWRTTAGKEFRQGTIRRLLSRPRYAGLMSDGETKAAWGPILDRETWERVQIILDGRAVANPRPTNARRWLLSGIAVCGVCGTPLMITQIGKEPGKPGRPVYGCKVKGCGHVRRHAHHLDAYVSVRTVALLNDPRQPEGELPVSVDHAPEWAALTAERAATEKLVKDYAASAGRVDILMARLDSIDKRMAELREREAGDARSRLLGTYRGITRDQFAALPLDVRRALVAASYRITVLPASGRGPGFRTEDVRLDPL